MPFGRASVLASPNLFGTLRKSGLARTLALPGLSFQTRSYAEGERRRLDYYPTQAGGITAADQLASRLDSRACAATSLAKAQALECARAASPRYMQDVRYRPRIGTTPGL